MITKIENNTKGLLYHGSSKQNLKVIDPFKTDKRRQPGHRDHNKVYGTWDIEFASMFCGIVPFRASKNRNDNNPWTMYLETIPISFKKPCSIYVLDSIWYVPPGKILGPEMYSKTVCKVMKEIKYKSVLRCLKKNGVNISLVYGAEKAKLIF